MQTLIKSFNQYRIQTTRFINFECDVNNLVFYSHTKMQSQSKMKGLTIWNFETISFVREINGFIHCYGFLNGIGYQIILINKK